MLTRSSVEPTCPRCGEPSEGLCAPCTGYVLRFDPYALRPGPPGPSMEDQVRRTAAFLSVDPKAPVRFIDSVQRRDGETFHLQFLQLVGLPDRGTAVLTRGDRETIHRILRAWVRTPPRSEQARTIAHALYIGAGTLPDMPSEVVQQFHSLASRLEVSQEPIAAPADFVEPPVSKLDEGDLEQVSTTEAPTPEVMIVLPPPGPSPTPEPQAAPPSPLVSLPSAERTKEEPVASATGAEGLGAEQQQLSTWMEGLQAEVERRHALVQAQLDELRQREEDFASREQRIRDEELRQHKIRDEELRQQQFRDEELRQQERDRELQKRAEAARLEDSRILYLHLFSLEGISREAASAIADAFRTEEHLRKASVEDIAAVPGVPPEEAALIRDAFSKAAPPRRDLREKAEDLLEEQRFEQALEVFDAMVTEDPREVETWFNRSEVLTLLGRDDEASASLDRALAIDPAHKGSLRELTNQLFEKGDFGLAAAHLNDLLKLAPTEADHWLRRAAELLKEGKATEATLIYNAILENDPTNLPASLALGDLLMAMDDVERADRTYSLVLQHHPDSPEAHLKKGLLLNRQGRWGAAIQLFNRAISLRFDFREAWAAKAQVLMAREKPKEALEAFERLVSLDDTQHAAWLGRAQAHLALGEEDKAAQAARRVLALSDGNAEAHEILNRLGVATRPQGAKSVGGERMPRETIDPGVLIEMADAFLEAGDGEAALQGYEEVLRGNPEEPKALFGKGRALHALDRYQEALRYFSEAVEVAPHEEEYARWRKRCEERVRKEGAA